MRGNSLTSYKKFIHTIVKTPLRQAEPVQFFQDLNTIPHCLKTLQVCWLGS